MSDEPAISVRELSFAYRLPVEPMSSFKEMAISLLRRRSEWRTLWALRDVSFEIARGEAVGVVGPNGAGKSTLMRVIGRILPPSAGHIVVRGDTAPVIELGAGLNVELNGFENIVLYGALLGRDPREMRARAEPIAEWAGLREFLHVPVRAYSSGMIARLAFAIATDRRPDALLIDEVLSVGDEEFTRRSVERITEQLSAGTSVLLVSHNLKTISTLVPRVIWLDHGSIVADGSLDVLERYRVAPRDPQLTPELGPRR